ncbi:glycerol kinase GlpK [Curvivirga aplysinae]|uniref:glycerol kinase GlpK n=1 Tax=Curvivirga aplysinae TaxID=2529852 RepID=UPI0012BC6434|nr:glycerol kinase GlpK [Curvivirga aplysinae]MTI10084.1 glycerol kinase [Curvivirga aplysinae]
MSGETKFILSIDQGTTSSRAILFDQNYNICAVGQEEFPQHFPKSGWVEHDPEDIWNTTISTCKEAIEKAGITASDIAAIGITNQRETTVVWDRDTGKPVYNAIVWQDRRTSETCKALKDAGHEAGVTKKTGLLLDPYFSATKVAWILDNVEGARAKAEAGKLAFGTVDSFLLWRLTDGKSHATDATNASRTMLYDIIEGRWRGTLLDLFRVPESVLPEVKDSAADFGTTDENIFGAAIPITGIAGDQQAATVGQACFKPGMMKSTYGTGCFALLNTGDKAVTSKNRLLTTISYQIDGKPTYALEGSIFVAGAAVQWLRDGVGLIEKAEQSGELALKADPNEEIYVVPAFVGMGAPYWDADCRGAIFGLTRNTGPAEIALATLESVCYQTADLLSAMRKDWGEAQETVLRVDGGMVASDWTMQRLSEILDAPVDRPEVLETTALGAAYLAGKFVGYYPDLDEFSQNWKLEKRFKSHMQDDVRQAKLAQWSKAIKSTLSYRP